MFILRTLLLAGLSCSSVLFCPSPAEVEQALTELTIPELLGTSEQQTACDVYLTHHTKYADLISDIERHIASNTMFGPPTSKSLSETYAKAAWPWTIVNSVCTFNK